MATEYWDWRHRHVTVPRDTLIAVLAALGVDASTDAAVRAALMQRRAERYRRMFPPTVVCRSGSGDRIGLHVDHDVEFEAWIELEDGGVRTDLVRVESPRAPVEVDGRLVVEFPHALPADLPLGWHVLRGRTSGGTETMAPLIVTPDRLDVPGTLGRAWGLTTQLYALRSRRSWGIGDLADLAELAAWSGRSLGAGFVLVNPLHAAEPTAPMEASPYLPTTRRYVNPLYIRVEAIPEYAYLPPSDRGRIDGLAAEVRKRDDTDDLLDRDAAWTAKRAALELVHRVPRGPGREAAFQAFVQRQGTALTDFATWCALAERHGPRWPRWPAGLHDPRSPAVAAARAELTERIDFYCWLQWIADEQLGMAQAAARDADMALGVVHDLAVGVHTAGADTWALRSLLARGVSVGAPPDEFNPHGQVWSQPPWHPHRLAEAGYRPHGEILRNVLRHAGGVRVDHVMGLFRLWWVPDGAVPATGTYVRYDHEAMVGVLALEAHRAGALVIGEDLGTVEPWVRDYLRERGILGTSVLWFERDWSGDGRPLRPAQWRPRSLATLTTHDLPSTAAMLSGEHLRLRERLGLLDRSSDEMAADHAQSVGAWLRLLRDLSLIRPGATDREIVVALHRFLAWTPAMLIGVSLSDVVDDPRPVNLPGTTDEYPNWRLPLADRAGRAVLIEDLAGGRGDLAQRIRDLVQAVSVGLA